MKPRVGILVAILAFGCRPTSSVFGTAEAVPVPLRDMPAAEQLMRADREFAAESRANGAAAWGANWAERGRLERPAGSVIGPEAVRVAIQQSLGPVLSRFVWEPVESALWWDDAGWTSGRWWVMEADGRAPADTGRYFTAWIRESGEWKVALDLSVPVCAGDAAAREFDFWSGDWRVSQRLVTRTGDWETYPATSLVRPIAGGCAMVEQWHGTVRFFWERMEEPVRLRAGSVRLYDPATRAWRIQWMDDRGREFGPAFVGRFEGTTGIFMGGTAPQRLRIIFDRPEVGRVDWREEIERAGEWTPIWTMRFERPS